MTMRSSCARNNAVVSPGLSVFVPPCFPAADSRSFYVSDQATGCEKCAELFTWCLLGLESREYVH